MVSTAHVSSQKTNSPMYVNAKKVMPASTAKVSRNLFKLTFLINIHFTSKFMHYLILALSVFLSRFWPVVMTKRGITLVLVNVQGNDSNPCPDCIGRALNL